MASDPNMMQVMNLIRKSSSVNEEVQPAEENNENAIALGYDIIEDLDSGMQYSTYPPQLVEQTSVQSVKSEKEEKKDE